MKIRNGFVTNSSSSSFIISKSTTPIDKDALLQIIITFYKKIIDRTDLLKKDADKYHLCFDQGSGYFNFKDEMDYDKKRGIMKQVERIYEFNVYDRVPVPEDWFNCQTYSEYESYWINEIKKSQTHAPFTIVDLSTDSKVRLLHYGESALEEEPVCVESVLSDIGDWYMGCFEDILGQVGMFANISENTEIDLASSISGNLENCEYCDMDPYSCKRNLSQIRGMTDAKQVFVALFGHIFIMSECGYISDSVVMMLAEICEYWCNHMG